ncbi:hypothetical protein BBW65_02720 [Helicobacter enhydrae]|uniref:Lipid/polyisoprenoid-binding YceI-like domain-containing protein n=1 Tax=Helicobacter enhydrae TaxID=222136 RepID=A0A1B1U4U8_9HELI|nr:YceI family protein [Helicobacter enhydrae]ANV97780.1 hypothetical protein BBW65_02720 [Helicobacter enhydrae]
MRKIFLTLGLASTLLLLSDELKIDTTHSSVAFSTKHLLVSNVKGDFKQFAGKIDFDWQSKMLKKLEGEIDIASIDTNNQKRDDHLRSADFFDVAKNPKAYFKMTKQSGNQIFGTLTLAGVSKDVVFQIEMSDTATHPKTKKKIIGFEITGEINRKDFGIGKNVLDSMIKDKIKIIINLEASQL